MIDPPRPEIKHAVQTAREAGLRTIMVTGDYPETARAVAEKIGLLGSGHRILAGIGDG